MNSVFAAKLLQNLRNKKGNKGFTLIELLVVVIIIGVLAAVALPNLLGQVAKGRQAEAKNILGTINRTQQAHRLEFGTFGEIGDYEVGGDPALPVVISLNVTTMIDADSDLAPDNALAVSFQPEFYYFSDGFNSVPTAVQLPDEVAAITGWEFPTSTTSISPTVGYAYAQSVQRYENDILNYTAVVSQNNTGSFASIICEEANINAPANGGFAPVSNVVDDGSVLATACDQGTEIK